MLSLSNTYQIGEVEDFILRAKKKSEYHRKFGNGNGN
ncbi:DNA ligase [Fusobacterium necrophorum subsp. funduliforme 1_1_36S]|nr:DNA ligase [Fusobacterium necrophorum subsp. funduliforme 1_1_36S]